MKAKRFKIRIQPLDQALRDVEKTWRLMSQRKFKSDKNETILCFHDLSMVSKVFSKERLRLIEVVRTKKPRSVNQLAILLERSQANVHKDVQYLSNLGILELEKKHFRGKKATSVQPTFEWSGFDIAVGE